MVGCKILSNQWPQSLHRGVRCGVNVNQKGGGKVDGGDKSCRSGEGNTTEGKKKETRLKRNKIQQGAENKFEEEGTM